MYESVGGTTFKACVENLAVSGRLIVIGFISGYADGSGWKEPAESSGGGASGASAGGAGAKPTLATPLPVRLLTKSASVNGFFLNHFVSHFKSHFAFLRDLYTRGKLASVVDPRCLAAETDFAGPERVADAVDYLYSQKSVGKVVIKMRKDAAGDKGGIRSSL